MSYKLLICECMKKYVLSIALLVASTGIFAQNRVVKKALVQVHLISEKKTARHNRINDSPTT